MPLSWPKMQRERWRTSHFFSPMVCARFTTTFSNLREPVQRGSVAVGCGARRHGPCRTPTSSGYSGGYRESSAASVRAGTGTPELASRASLSRRPLGLHTPELLPPVPKPRLWSSSPVSVPDSSAGAHPNPSSPGNPCRKAVRPKGHVLLRHRVPQRVKLEHHWHEHTQTRATLRRQPTKKSVTDQSRRLLVLAELKETQTEVTNVSQHGNGSYAHCSPVCPPRSATACVWAWALPHNGNCTLLTPAKIECKMATEIYHPAKNNYSY